MGRFADKPPDLPRDGLRLIVADCSGLDRVGDELAAALEGLPTCFIDHHKTNTVSGPRYINGEAPATASLVLALWEAFDEPLPRETAEHLLLSLCTDTGFFRHLDETGAAAFLDAQKLVAAGGSPKKVFAALNGGRTLASRQLLGTVLARAESFFDGRLMVSVEELSETERYGRENRDSDMLYQLLQSVSGVEAIAIVRDDGGGNCAVGLRSKDAVDVSQIAQKLDGGGHKNASGALVAGTIAEVKERVVGLFKEFII
jgi:phosphoesterase RecJ-like protein